MSPRFAVMFKTHFWDAFTERQPLRRRLAYQDPKVFVGNFAGNWARRVCVTFSESWKMPG
jgi:hypothetical protein